MIVAKFVFSKKLAFFSKGELQGDAFDANC